MRLKYNGSGPTRVEVLLEPGDKLEVSDALGNRLLATTPQMVEVAKAKPPAAKPGKPKGDK